MENNYYTPDLEDIRVGYKCKKFCHLKGKYENIMIGKYELHEILDEELNDCYEHDLRTPYLTKEQIEAEGWSCIDEKNNHFIKNNFKMIFYEDEIRKIQIVEGNNSFMGLDVLYKGRCPSINEFRTICKLLNIK